MATKTGSGRATTAAASTPQDYRYLYTQEIAQMMFVFGEVQDALPETVQLVENIVRTQIIEIVIQARNLAQRRGSRTLAAEDLIFLIRYDRGKVNRLRTYLSWRDVRKVKESGDREGGGVEMDVIDDPATADPADKMSKSKRRKIKLPWELTNIYSELIRADSDEEDEDDIEAHEESLQRLKDADEATRRMTREEYVHYSECRQASFTFRKSKRFKEFINVSDYLSTKPNEETIDILGFLAFEIVRSLCVGGLEVKKALEQAEEESKAEKSSAMAAGAAAARLNVADGVEGLTGSNFARSGGGADGGSTRKRKGDTMSPERGEVRRRKKKQDMDGGGATSSVEGAGPLSPDRPVCTLFAPPPSERTPLKPAHILEAFARMQRGRASSLRSFKGGFHQSRLKLI